MKRIIILMSLTFTFAATATPNVDSNFFYQEAFSVITSPTKKLCLQGLVLFALQYSPQPLAWQYDGNIPGREKSWIKWVAPPIYHFNLTRAGHVFRGFLTVKIEEDKVRQEFRCRLSGNTPFFVMDGDDVIYTAFRGPETKLD